MADPWLTLIGLTDDSAAQLSPASRAALEAADVVIGGPRHLELVGAAERGVPWPVPFSTAPVVQARGRATVVLVSGDPFWFGAGNSLLRDLDPGEWRSLPAVSTFSLVANALGWPMEAVQCHGLHAAPFERLRSAMAPHARLICLVRDGPAVGALANWLASNGAGAASLHVCERMGGDQERVRVARADAFDLVDVAAPVAVGVAFPGDVGLSKASGLPDQEFEHDGQITKRPIRALTMSALAPRPGEHLWDIGAGSGSISVEWALAGGRATAFERRADRLSQISANAAAFGLEHRISIVLDGVPDALQGQSPPDAVFVGGGADAPLFDALFAMLPAGVRCVANAVTLETEALLLDLHARRGGSLLRVDVAEAAPLGSFRGWRASRPIVQWSVTL